MQAEHEKYMRVALQLAQRAAAEGEVPVGAIVVCDGKIVGRGRNRRESKKNALHHAEVEAIEKACKTLGGWRLHRCTLYVTLEPCPMCAGAIINARIKTLCYGTTDEKAGSCGTLIDLFACGYNHKPEVIAGVLAPECASILQMFFKQLREKRKKEKYHSNEMNQCKKEKTGMKYMIILGDGMSDEPIAQLEGRTPLEAAHTPVLDRLAGMSQLGIAHTIPQGMKPGSDTANLAVLGYDPKQYYTGRSPLEALSIGVDMKDTDVALRCNFVTLSEEADVPYHARTILDHSSDEISTQECAVLLDAVREVFENDTYRFYVGTSYRHLLVWQEGAVVELTPPHDVLEQVIGTYLPQDAVLRDMMEKSFAILNNHPVNLARARRGLRKANSCWFWGAGTRPALSNFTEKTGKKGAMISAVDLLKGIAVGAGMQVITVEGATGGLETNYEGKAMAAVDALTQGDCDFVYIHVEAPDEMGHQGSVEKKVKAIEELDKRVIGVVCEQMEQRGVDFRLLVMPDHPTPVRVRTHTADPVPFMLYDSRVSQGSGLTYSEKNAISTGVVVEEGFRTIERLLEK